MKNFLTGLFIFTALPTFAATTEFEQKICGVLIYVNESYVLNADHGDSYIVREDKIDLNSLDQTAAMSAILENHDYSESAAPEVCFYDVKAERVGTNELNILEVREVQ